MPSSSKLRVFIHGGLPVLCQQSVSTPPLRRHARQDVASTRQCRRAGMMRCRAWCCRAACGGRTRFTRQRPQVRNLSGTDTIVSASVVGTPACAKGCRRNGRFCNSGLADQGHQTFLASTPAATCDFLVCGRCGKKFVARPRRDRQRRYVRVEPGLRWLWQDRAPGRPDGTLSSGNGCGAVAELWRGACTPGTPGS